MVINDKLLDKLSNKENCYVAAIFNKYSMNLNKDKMMLPIIPMEVTRLTIVCGFCLKSFVLVFVFVINKTPLLRVALPAHFVLLTVHFIGNAMQCKEVFYKVTQTKSDVNSFKN